ncbi:MAG: hypothetical protein V7L11_18215 [Nostoc sp.]|uniref:hypothetical protein n=1 Tax=Nostoc sp. TaxID=1180 RepID=UPI002FFCB22B
MTATYLCHNFKDYPNKKLHPQGHGAWGIKKNHNAQCPMPNAQCPMPQVGGQLSLATHKGMKFPADFQ